MIGAWERGKRETSVSDGKENFEQMYLGHRGFQFDTIAAGCILAITNDVDSSYVTFFMQKVGSGNDFALVDSSFIAGESNNKGCKKRNCRRNELSAHCIDLWTFRTWRWFVERGKCRWNGPLIWSIAGDKFRKGLFFFWGHTAFWLCETRTEQLKWSWRMWRATHTRKNYVAFEEYIASQTRIITRDILKHHFISRPGVLMEVSKIQEIFCEEEHLRPVL